MEDIFFPLHSLSSFSFSVNSWFISMGSVSMLISSSSPFQNLSKPLKSISQSSISHKPHIPSIKATPLSSSTTKSNNPQNQIPLTKLSTTTLQTLRNLHFPLITSGLLFTSLPSFASEDIIAPSVSNRIDVESILVTIDDFFNRNPFFVAGCTFIWLVVIPVAKFYLGKFKPVSAIDAFRKLRNEPNAQLLDIRDEKTLVSLGSPNLKLLNKNTVQIQFNEGEEESFVKKVKERFPDPENTIICILDSFDGNSLKVAELMVKNGFKEACAIRDGVRGKNGWLAIQETLLPPSVHIYPKKKKKKSKISHHLEVNGGVNQQTENNNQEASSSSSESVHTVESKDDEQVDKTIMPDEKTKSRASSPYPNYPDMKPPSSPTPSKP